MNQVLQTILDYVKTPNTDYALLITGPWGCGKTYFWKKVVEPKLQQQINNGTSLRPVYVSLYGCENTKEIGTQLFLGSLPLLQKNETIRWLGSKGGKCLKWLFEARTSIKVPEIDFRWLVNTKDTVLCFDDLERTRLPMKEVLGYINTFIEHKQAKVIIICNEDEIIKKSNEEDKQTYEKMKEKVVGFSITFQPDYNKALQSLIDEHKDNAEFHQFLENHQKLIGQIFHKSETYNIRTLRRVLSALRTIFLALKNGGIKPDDVARQVIYALEPTACEFYASRANADQLRKIHSRSMMTFAALPLSDSKDKKSYGEVFVERYLSERGSEVVSCPSICEYILTGFLDRQALLAWARELTKQPDEREKRIRRLTLAPMEMDDDEFIQTATQVLNEVEAGEFSTISDYLNLYNWFEWFAEEGLIPLSGEEVLAKFRSGLTKAEQAERLEPKQLRHGIHPALEPRTDKGRAFLQDLLKANERVLAHRFRKRIQDAVSHLRDNPQAFINALADGRESGLLHVPVFQELDADDTVRRILALPNDLKSRFETCMKIRYERYALPAEFAIELPVLKQIRDAMKKHCETHEGKDRPIPMSLFIVQRLVGVLDHAIKRIEAQTTKNQPRA